MEDIKEMQRKCKILQLCAEGQLQAEKDNRQGVLSAVLQCIELLKPEELADCIAKVARR